MCQTPCMQMTLQYGVLKNIPPQLSTISRIPSTRCAAGPRAGHYSSTQPSMCIHRSQPHRGFLWSETGSGPSADSCQNPLHSPIRLPSPTTPFLTIVHLHVSVMYTVLFVLFFFHFICNRTHSRRQSKLSLHGFEPCFPWLSHASELKIGIPSPVNGSANNLKLNLNAI